MIDGYSFCEMRNLDRSQDTPERIHLKLLKITFDKIINRQIKINLPVRIETYGFFDIMIIPFRNIVGSKRSGTIKKYFNATFLSEVPYPVNFCREAEFHIAVLILPVLRAAALFQGKKYFPRNSSDWNFLVGILNFQIE